MSDLKGRLTLTLGIITLNNTILGVHIEFIKIDRLQRHYKWDRYRQRDVKNNFIIPH